MTLSRARESERERERASELRESTHLLVLSKSLFSASQLIRSGAACSPPASCSACASRAPARRALVVPGVVQVFRDTIARHRQVGTV